MTPESLVIITVIAVIVFNILLTYFHALMDESVTFDRIGFTISAVSDSPERQLVALLMVSLFSFIVMSMMHVKQRTGDVVSNFTLILCMTLFGTILTRLSSSPTLHNTLAACTFLCLLVLMVAMTHEIYARPEAPTVQRAVAVILTVALVLLYVALIMARFSAPKIWNSHSSQLLAIMELVTLVVFALELFQYFN
jgi:hypothetical protein